jgi:ribosome modulation factor
MDNSKKSYSLEYIQEQDGGLKIRRNSNGFSGLEIIGFLEHAKMEVYQQMHGLMPVNNRDIKIQVNVGDAPRDAQEELRARAYKRGVADNIAGKTTFDNPYRPGQMSDLWREGFCAGSKNSSTLLGTIFENHRPWEPYLDFAEEFRKGATAYFEGVREKPELNNPHALKGNQEPNDMQASRYEAWDAGWKYVERIFRTIMAGGAAHDNGEPITANPHNEPFMMEAWSFGWEGVGSVDSSNIRAAFINTDRRANFFRAGYDAKLGDRPKSINPHKSPECIQEWDRGWETARKNQNENREHTEAEKNGENRKLKTAQYYEGWEAKASGKMTGENNPYDRNDGQKMDDWFEGFADCLNSPLVKSTIGREKQRPEKQEISNMGYLAFMQTTSAPPANPFNPSSDKANHDLWTGGWELAATALKKDLDRTVEDGDWEESVIAQGIEGYLSEDENRYDMHKEPHKFLLWEKGHQIGKKQGITYNEIAYNKGCEDGENNISFNPFKDRAQQKEWERGHKDGSATISNEQN